MDCLTDPEDNVRAALEAGLAGITFTEHFDLHPHERAGCIYRHDEYSQQIRRLQREYSSHLRIGLGIEVGYFDGGLDGIAAFLVDKAFDLVILSFHYVDDRPLHLPAGWAGLDAATGMRRYLQGVADGLETCAQSPYRGLFDVLGHLDLAKRYSHRMFGVVAMEECADLVDRILSRCLEAAIVPEINTSTIRQGVGDAMPGVAVVRRYAELGGRAMSLGSDAHRATDIGADFDQAAAMLIDAGLEQAVFQSRHAHYRPVPGRTLQGGPAQGIEPSRTEGRG
ncbi:MAG: histidinol-phosphatase HisJ family protein [Phycisphaerales bacterium]|nr:MAG: histidinol-phosphatase HisJ family protein [Phycisphaerales bacterium]